ncbi:MAG: molecular chaperone TorD family protein [Ignavibacteriae bacterium]|nr:molecular chaperone TorD family protein [Ignavibacteriota bacterium]
MNERVQMYDWFARMLSYPNDMRYGIWDIGLEIDNLHLTSHISHHLDKFKKGVEGLTVEELEELYTRTFDINPIANLEIGWHLYGEQYERGEFLVMMRSVLREHAVEESSELPDHLTHILLALGRMKKEEADAFAVKYISPSIEKIVEAFGETDNPYVHLLHAIKSFLEQQHQFNTSKYQPEVVAHE